MTNPNEARACARCGLPMGVNQGVTSHFQLIDCIALLKEALVKAGQRSTATDVWPGYYVTIGEHLYVVETVDSRKNDGQVIIKARKVD